MWRRQRAKIRQAEKAVSDSACDERYQLEGVDGRPHLHASTLLSCPPQNVGKTGPDDGYGSRASEVKLSKTWNHVGGHIMHNLCGVEDAKIITHWKQRESCCTRT